MDLRVFWLIHCPDGSVLLRSCVFLKTLHLYLLPWSFYWLHQQAHLFSFFFFLLFFLFSFLWVCSFVSDSSESSCCTFLVDWTLWFLFSFSFQHNSILSFMCLHVMPFNHTEVKTAVKKVYSEKVQKHILTLSIDH